MNIKISLFFFALFSAFSAYAVQITDMANKTVDIPAHTERVFASAPPATMLIYVLAPQKLVAANIPVKSKYFTSDLRYLEPNFVSLPVVGGWHGSVKGANMEALLALKPQLVLGWKNDFVMKQVEDAFKKFAIPVVFVAEDGVEDEPSALRFVGKTLGVESRGELLARDASARIAYAKKVALSVEPVKRPLVYYAEGADGLNTECSDSFHVNALKTLGVKMPFACEQKNMVGMDRISAEQLIKINPDIIIATDSRFMQHVFKDTRFVSLKAIRAKRVYLVPKDPINFLDRPPSFMRILGIEWLASVIYPHEYKKDIGTQTASFFKLYLRKSITHKQAVDILQNR